MLVARPSRSSRMVAPAARPSIRSATHTQLTAAPPYPRCVTSMNGYGYQWTIAPRINVNAALEIERLGEDRVKHDAGNHDRDEAR